MCVPVAVPNQLKYLYITNTYGLEEEAIVELLKVNTHSQEVVPNYTTDQL